MPLKKNVDAPIQRRKRPNFLAMFCIGFPSIFFAYLAVFVAYLSTTPVPMGTFFWILFQPAVWMAVKTPEVPASAPLHPRPKNELFLELPSGAKMPMSGLGMCCRGTAYHDESVRNAVLWYLLQGGRHIDTAALYLNHKPIGLAIKDAIARGIPRSEIFITTKIWTSHYNETLAANWVETMLKELDVEYVDLVLMHAPRRNMGLWPGALPRWHKMIPVYSEDVEGFLWEGGFNSIWPNDEDQDFKEYGCVTAKQCRVQTWRALSAARDRGLVKEIGVSNFRIRHMRELMSLGLAPIAAHQLAYHPWVPQWQEDIVQFCHANKIALTAYHSLGGNMNLEKTFSAETMREIAAAHQRSPAAILQRWALQHNISVIPGSGNPHHMKENLEVYEFELTAEEMSRIDNLRSNSSTLLPFMPEWINS